MNKLESFNQARETLSKSYELTLDLENQFKFITDGFEFDFKHTDKQNTIEAFSVDGKYDTPIMLLDDDIIPIVTKIVDKIISSLVRDGKKMDLYKLIDELTCPSRAEAIQSIKNTIWLEINRSSSKDSTNK